MAPAPLAPLVRRSVAPWLVGLVLALTGCGNESAPADPEEDPPELNAASCPGPAALAGTLTPTMSDGGTVPSVTVRGTTANCASRFTPTCNTTTGAEAVWRFVATADGVAEANTCGSSFNTVLGVSTTLGASDLACNNDIAVAPEGCNRNASGVRFAVVAGRTYYLNVDANGTAARGAYTLSLSVDACEPGEQVCNLTCTAVATDTANCGACGNACGAGQVCEAGACRCPAGQSLCNGQCVDLQSDNEHCGACGARCEGRSCCAGQCRDTSTDSSHCGRCGVECNGSCQVGRCDCADSRRPIIRASGTYFGQTRRNCTSAARNVNTGYGQRSHEAIWAVESPIAGTAFVTTCGSSFAAWLASAPTYADLSLTGTIQGDGAVGPGCTERDAQLSFNVAANTRTLLMIDGRDGLTDAGDYVLNVVICPTGQTLCNGRCVDARTDAANCGACGRACAAGVTCTNGVCGGNCGDTQSSATNCGACGRACASGQTCVAGACRCMAGQTCACPAGQTLCDGVCRDLQNDRLACGTCGLACARGCTQGQCDCRGRGDAVGTINANGTYRGRTRASCGSFGRTDCGGLHGASTPDDLWQVTSPMDGTLNITTCGSSFDATLYAGEYPNGDNFLTSDADGNEFYVQRCATEGAAGPGCASGDAHFTMPVGGGQRFWLTVDGARARTDLGDYQLNVTFCPGAQRFCGGACRDVQSDAAHCGACGNACGTGATCMAGVCRCPTGQTLCGGACVSLPTSTANCGACGRACGGTSVCNAGVCGCPTGQSCTCGAGELACNGTCVRADAVTSCGACGRVCGAGQSCVGGTCVCPAGRTMCGNACVDLRANDANCGACGRVCSTGRCCNGACTDTTSDRYNCGECNIECRNDVCQNGRCSYCNNIQRPNITTPGSYLAQFTNFCPPADVRDFPGIFCDGQLHAAQDDFHRWTLEPPATGMVRVSVCGYGTFNIAQPARMVLAAGTNTLGETAPMTTCATTGAAPAECGSDAPALNLPVTAGQLQTVYLASRNGNLSGSYRLNVEYCPNPRTFCSSACVDLQTSAEHCGACGNACAPGAACVAGACVCPAGSACACPTNTTACGTGCARLDSTLHCGACGNVCAMGATCTGGRCSCPNLTAAQLQPIVASGVVRGTLTNRCESRAQTFERGVALGATTIEDIWQVVPPSSGTVTFSTCGSSFDTTLYVGAAPGASSSMSADLRRGVPSGCMARDAIVTVPVTQSVPLFVTVDSGRLREVGAYQLRTTFCAAGQGACDGACTDLQRNNTHCGACGNACPRGTTCTSGRCG